MRSHESGAAVPPAPVAPASAALTGSIPVGAWSVAMADLTLELHSSFTDFDATTAAVAASAVKILPGVTAAGVVRIGKDGVLTCLSATNPQALLLVQAEHRAGDGPCRHVLNHTNQAKTVIDDVAGDQRWPEYAAEAASIGVRAVLAVRLDAGDAAGQALLVLTDTGFDRCVVDGVDVFAAHAAVAVTQARLHADLLRAMDSRDVIGQAKGVLMERHKVTSDRAFAMLVKTSQNSNLPLRQVADRVVNTGR